MLLLLTGCQTVLVLTLHDVFWITVVYFALALVVSFDMHTKVNWQFKYCFLFNLFLTPLVGFFLCLLWKKDK